MEFSTIFGTARPVISRQSGTRIISFIATEVNKCIMLKNLSLASNFNVIVRLVLV